VLHKHTFIALLSSNCLTVSTAEIQLDVLHPGSQRYDQQKYIRQKTRQQMAPQQELNF